MNLRRTLTAAAAAVALCATVLPIAATGAQGAEPPASPPPVDLTDPAAGITDPLAGVAPLDRDCADGQTDVNHASAADIAAAFGLDSAPTVGRIIEGRPWLKAADLVSVPGVPPSSLARLQSDGCAEPVTEPEPATLACTDDDQLDLQTASANDIARRLRVPRMTAAGLVANRPIPQDLHQLVAPRTPGLSSDRASRFEAADDVCVTPMAYDHAGTGWRWVRSDAGAVVEAPDDPDYALIVPAGVLAGTGTWGTVTPDVDADVPTADFHLQDVAFTGEVAVRLPDISSGNPMVLHEANPGQTRLSWGSGTHREPGGTVVAAQTSLSESSSLDRDPICRTALASSVWHCTTAFDARDEDVIDLAIRAGRLDALRAASGASPIPSGPNGPCPSGLTRVQSTGTLVLGMVCGVEATEGMATWTFSNATGASTLFGVAESFGAVYKVTRESGPGLTPTPVHPYQVNDGRLSGRLAELFAKGGAIVPGAGLAFSKPPGQPMTELAFTALDPLLHGGFFVIFNVASVTDTALDAAGATIPFSALGDCAQKIVDGVSGSAAISAASSCVQGAATTALEFAMSPLQAKKAAGTLSAAEKANLEKLAGAHRFLKSVSWVLLGTNYASSFVVQATGSFTDGVTGIVYTAPPPAGPPSSNQPTGGGSTDPGGSPVPDGSMIIKVSSGPESWLLDTAGVAHPITDGGTYLCLADRYPVRYHLDPARFDDYATAGVGAAATCPTGAGDPVVIAPGAEYGIRNVILREGDGTAWIIDGDGWRTPISDGSSFNCFAETYLVWDWVAPVDVYRFSADPSVAARWCIPN